MKKYILSAIKGMFLGIAIGLCVSIFFNYLNGADTYLPSTPVFTSHFARPLNAVTVSVVLWALMGLVFSIGALIFQIERWILLKRTIVNFFVYYIFFTPLAFMAHWFIIDLPHILVFTIIFTLIYVLIWFINAQLIKNDIKQINEKLRK